MPRHAGDIPEPVLKLLGNLSRMPSVMAAMTTEHEGSGTHTGVFSSENQRLSQGTFSAN